MSRKLLPKYMASLIFIFLLTFIINHEAFANEIEKSNSNEEVIKPVLTHSEVKVQPLYKASTNSKSFNNVNDAIAYIMSEAKKFKTTVSFEYKGTVPNFANEIEKAFTKTGYDYVHGTLSSWESIVEIYKDRADVKITLKYIGTKAQEDYVTKRVKEIAKSLKKSGMTDVEKVLAVNNYIVTHADYTLNTSTSPHHVYTLLKEGKGVCQAYALLAYRLLTEMGIATRYVVGVANGDNHAWNLVKVDGVWYFLDTTFNDASPVLSNSSFKYFLVNSATLKKDHSWIEKNYPSATKNSYFYKITEGIVCNGDIYYRNDSNYKLYRLNIKTGKTEKVLDKLIGYFAASNEKIYFSDYSNKGYLTVYNIKSGKTQILDKSKVDKLQIINKTLYYYVGNLVKKYNVALPNDNVPRVKTIPVSAKNIKVTNNYNKADVITFKNLKLNTEYTIYRDSKKQTKLQSFFATRTKQTMSLKQLDAKAGAIYITVTEHGFKESTPTKVSYLAEKLPALAAKSVTITNKVKSDTITFNNLKKGFTYTVYSDSKLNKKLVSFTAKSTTHTITVKQLGVKAGSVYIVVSKSGYRSSSATKVNFKAQSK